ncbi:Hsp70 family protein [Myceligenerans pegani]|uniref:Hsp70 family protein n=1 Tax=Myceligenerans pegani TaxID=2776917 RepID=A0ABR9N3Z7_9MICO|nr:Hsp70 family protein [Myceligenerans sp. TRM 65318]MBE1878389.1 Hsp70 family protein [Myceligenerans sp. TRM 65318]MBE3020660.1 Hsp70 family protein [Myceligenerans sp. TRM 65318]
MRDTIDFGIDLGTTNSAIAVARGRSAQVVRNSTGDEFTPSAVSVSRSGAVRVGRRARDHVVADPGNACAEFKLRMGRTDQDMLFEAAGRSMSPEELSAQVLMALRGNVELTGERLETAVITVPAAFTADQTAATMKAAELAGLRSATLLQEPTAAAWAYLADADLPDKGFWLVYDFGGGTFDAAVVKIEDGEFTVVNHAGDNSLGGKRIDWALVEDVLLPAFRAAGGPSEVSPENPRTRGALAILKHLAERAKIELSVQRSTVIEEDVVVDGEAIELVHTMTRDDVDRAARPLVEASVLHCRQALSGAGLDPRDVDRVLLVGGSSQVSLVHEMLADPDRGLGIRVDRSQDPITVVARGAAIYAGTQPMPEEIRRSEPVAAGTVRLNLDHTPAGLDDDPLIGGRAESDDVADWSGWTIELHNITTNPPWTTGQVALEPDGTFRMRLRAPETTAHTFEIALRDPVGSQAPTDRATVTYDHRSGGMGPDAPHQAHTIGVGLADNTVEVLVASGATLPATGRVHGLRTTETISKSAGTGRITIPVLSGEHARADRNEVVGRLDLRPDDVVRDVPAGTEVEVELTVTKSFQIVDASAYVPYLDEEFGIQVDLRRPLLPGIDVLRAERADVGHRYAELRDQARDLDAREATERLDRFDSEGVTRNLDRLLDQAAVDQDAVATCQAALLEAQSALDEAERLLGLPRVAEEGRQAVATAQEAVTHYRARGLEAELSKVRTEMEVAIADGDQAVIERRTQEAWSIALRAIPEEHQALMEFSDYESLLGADSRPEVRRLLADGRAAIATNDLRRLEGINARLRRFAAQAAPVGRRDRTGTGPGRTFHGSTVDGDRP